MNDTNFNRGWQTLLLVVAAILVSSLARAGTYDSKWWLGLSERERLEFVTGALDCYINDVHGTQYLDESFSSNVKAITDYYAHHPEDSKLSVLDVMRRVPRHTTPQAAHGRSKDNTVDGEYWRQADGPWRSALVEGYLACRAKYLQSHTTMPIASIVSRISKWYGVSEADPSEIDDHRSADKIGDLIDRMVTQQHP